MAIFKLLENCIYKVEGTITEEDVAKINTLQVRTILILQNTAGQSSSIINQITTDNVCFRILGGLDYFEKTKYKEDGYISRTESNPKGLAEILKYFERIESEMDPNWTDTQKCMYAYSALAVDMDYVADLEENIIGEGITERSLNGILYNQLTCAGFAKVFKEMMDRLGIPCYYQNQKGLHDFNVVELDGKLRGIDVTWDCTHKEDGRCTFRYFGRDPYFYKERGHQIKNDREETEFNLTTFTDQEIEENLSVIEKAIESREKVDYSFRNYDRERKSIYLPVNRYFESLRYEKLAFVKLKLLANMGAIPKEVIDSLDSVKPRQGFIDDYLGTYDRTVDIRGMLNKIRRELGMQRWLSFKDNQVMISPFADEDRRPINQEEQDAIIPTLNEDVRNYYTHFYHTEAKQIDDLIETYRMILNIPQELAPKTAIVKTDLYTKLKFLADGGEFFDYLGLPKEEVEEVSTKARECLAREIENHKSDSVDQRKSGLDLLYVIIQNDVIDKKTSGVEYTEDDLNKLMDDVRTYLSDIDFTEEECQKKLNEILSRTIKQEDIKDATIEYGIDISDVNDATEMLKSERQEIISQEIENE